MKNFYFIALVFSMALSAMAEPIDYVCQQAAEDDSEWIILEGNAKYTDAFTEIFASANEEKDYPTLEVTIQQNAGNPSIYRLVNPYKNWTNPYSCEVTYDESQDYYLEVYTIEESGKAYIGKFETGLSVKGKGDFGVISDIEYYVDFYTVEYMLEHFPDAFGEFADGVVTYPASYKLEGYNFPTINGWFGAYDPYGQFYPVNQMGNFKIEIPSVTDVVKSVEDNMVNTTEYYDIQGKRIINPSNGIYIKVDRLQNGSIHTSKVIR